MRGRPLLLSLSERSRQHIELQLQFELQLQVLLNRTFRLHIESSFDCYCASCHQC